MDKQESFAGLVYDSKAEEIPVNVINVMKKKTDNFQYRNKPFIPIRTGENSDRMTSSYKKLHFEALYLLNSIYIATKIRMSCMAT